ncbi:hypothetical protein M5E06_17555 [Azospirillum sp. A1-3]|uniref:hypothetical protein n=1 Tax=Azospirillum sp. A1-3 TaxID=185874 RepID=UPI0020772B57|nr:hypothetical protein [Azospirillum sp. A1-3]MCM8735941.1 hypothetical protein [Azospirillum sp. A1-3]
MNAIARIQTDDAQPIAGIGHNGGPAPNAFEKAEAEVSKLYEEASLWLDGAKVDSQELADGIANLLNMLRAAEKAADAARTAEKEPHLKAGRAVDAQYKPVLERAKLAADACKKALAPWLQKVEAEKAAAAEAARREADEKRKAAEEAIRSRDAANLEETAAAEALLKEAKKADAAAKKAEKDGAKAGNSTIGRAVSTRTIYRAEVTDARAFARHVWANHAAELNAFLDTLAARLVSAGSRDLPGVTVHTETTVV